MVPAELKQRKDMDTLPADFNDWDNRSLPSTLPEDFEEFDSASDSAARREAGEVWHAPLEPSRQNTLLQPQKKAVETTASTHDADEEENGNSTSRRKVLMGSASVLFVVLVAGTGGMVLHRHQDMRESVVSTHPANVQAVNQDSNSMLKPQTGAAIAQAATISDTLQDKAPESSMQQSNSAPDVHVDSAAMTAQLNAPNRIQKVNPRNRDSESAPQEFSTDDMRALAPGAPAMTPTFSHGMPKVKQETVVTGPVHISSGEAMTLVLQRRSPVYPQSALTLRITGTVSLRVRVSANGSVVNVDPISGPKLLYSAAADSIRNWKFRPLLISEHPVDFITNINVNFQINK